MNEWKNSQKKLNKFQLNMALSFSGLIKDYRCHMHFTATAYIMEQKNKFPRNFS